MTGHETPDQWWGNLSPQRKETVHRWLSEDAPRHHPTVPGQTSITDLLSDDPDQPIPYKLT